MARYKPVSINKLSFSFCRYSVAIMVWLSYLIHSQFLLVTVSIIFLLSAIFKVKRAPMIIIGDYTIAKLFKMNGILVNERAIFFAHLLGFFFSLLCLGIVHFFPISASWLSVGIFAILKTISALGYCPATKLYDCLFNGTCCVNSK